MNEELQHIKKLAFRYFEGATSADEAKSLFAFLRQNKENQSLFRSWENEWFSSAAQFNPLLNERWTQVETAQKNADEIRSSIPLKKTFRNRYLFIAASVMVLLIGGVITFQQSQKHRPEQLFTMETDYGQKSKIIMPDSSVVWLNSGSSLTYSDAYGRRNRQVNLIGEGYFEVKKGPKDFIVNTNNYSVVVKGTKFNVSAYPDDALSATTLTEGVVEFQYKSRSLTMSPGEKLELNTKTHALTRTRNVSADNAGTWMQNRMEYHQIDLDELLKKLSREYAKTIVLENDSLRKQSFSISIDTNEKLPDVLKAIAKIIPIKVTTENDTIKLM